MEAIWSNPGHQTFPQNGYWWKIWVQKMLISTLMSPSASTNTNPCRHITQQFSKWAFSPYKYSSNTRSKPMCKHLHNLHAGSYEWWCTKKKWTDKSKPQNLCGTITTTTSVGKTSGLQKPEFDYQLFQEALFHFIIADDQVSVTSIDLLLDDCSFLDRVLMSLNAWNSGSCFCSQECSLRRRISQTKWRCRKWFLLPGQTTLKYWRKIWWSVLSQFSIFQNWLKIKLPWVKSHSQPASGQTSCIVHTLASLHIGSKEIETDIWCWMMLWSVSTVYLGIMMVQILWMSLLVWWIELG